MEKLQGKGGGFKLHNGVKMPYLGLGVYLSEEGKEVVNAVEWALSEGYRHIDTAAAYGNEKGVGEAVRNSGIRRQDLFITSKVWNSDQGYDSTLKAFDASLNRLNLDYLDLYLIHWPVAGKYKDTWRALEQLYNEKRVRAIGVSNFLLHHLKDLLAGAEVVPMVNQVEFHPYLLQKELHQFCRQRNIQYEAWSPLMQGNIFGKPEFEELAERYNCTVAQLVLRWNLQKGVVTIPKSSNRERIRENSDLFHFEISAGDMERIDKFDKGKRFGPDPDNFDF